MDGIIGNSEAPQQLYVTLNSDSQIKLKNKRTKTYVL
jgi:hypothetical protein